MALTYKVISAQNAGNYISVPNSAEWFFATPRMPYCTAIVTTLDVAPAAAIVGFTAHESPHFTAIVAWLLTTPFCVIITGTVGPGETPAGTATLIW